MFPFGEGAAGVSNLFHRPRATAHAPPPFGRGWGAASLLCVPPPIGYVPPGSGRRRQGPAKRPCWEGDCRAEKSPGKVAASQRRAPRIPGMRGRRRDTRLLAGLVVKTKREETLGPKLKASGLGDECSSRVRFRYVGRTPPRANSQSF
uniref:Uncharacterized protein n=1 Tax=Myotis myotis TaxID=51298 RepID=A0A7J7RUS3_MYOMY|nr:hypothetical protein mMyoMyo1_010147 [Myotis myotis]